MECLSSSLSSQDGFTVTRLSERPIDDRLRIIITKGKVIPPATPPAGGACVANIRFVHRIWYLSTHQIGPKSAIGEMVAATKGMGFRLD
jgi:hypothetical protein